MWDMMIEDGGGRPFTVLTGGEPMLQVDGPLVDALKAEGFEIAIESNGTLPARPGSTGSASAPRPAANWCN
jgi:7-carboxy-7-deazaguanine synthase